MGPRGAHSRRKDSTNRPKRPRPAALKPTTSDNVTAGTPIHPVPFELQQALLNIFSAAFVELLRSEDFSTSLQEVKQALFERNFDKAFGTDARLETYAARWSPSRALCYVQILAGIQGYLMRASPLEKIARKDGPSASITTSSPAKSVVCFGGGSAEVVAFAGFLSFLFSSFTPTEDLSEVQSKAGIQVKLLLVDIASWGKVVRKLYQALTTPPTLSKYASATAKSNNSAMIPQGSLDTKFEQADALNLSDISRILGEEPKLITFLFTLNELYASSVSKTTAFLLHVTAAAPLGTLLLVVDSPGSYSETAVGNDLKKYPMQWLLDHSLLEKTKPDEDVSAAWEKLVSEESQWFRLAEKLRYPIALEDMRYQIHLYRRT